MILTIAIIVYVIGFFVTLANMPSYGWATVIAALLWPLVLLFVLFDVIDD